MEISASLVDEEIIHFFTPTGRSVLSRRAVARTRNLYLAHGVKGLEPPPCPAPPLRGIDRIKVKSGPFGSSDWPLILETLVEPVDAPYLKVDAGSPFPIGFFALQKVREKSLLQRNTIAGVEMGPML